MATEQTIFEINDKIRPAADTLARSLARVGSLTAYLVANGTLAEIVNDSSVIEGTATLGRKGVRGDDVHTLVALLVKIKAVVTDEDMAVILRVAVNPGT